MKTRTLLYLSIVFTGIILGKAFPFFEVLGASPAIVLLAVFLPYLGWKITVIVHTLSCSVALPILFLTAPQLLSSLITNMPFIGNPEEDLFVQTITAYSTQISIAIIVMAYCWMLVIIWFLNRGLTKIGFYKRIQI